MKPARLSQTVVAPGCWGELPWGNYYREALEQQLNPWFAKCMVSICLKSVI